jgi:hypothetical protein
MAIAKNGAQQPVRGNALSPSSMRLSRVSLPVPDAGADGCGLSGDGGG